MASRLAKVAFASLLLTSLATADIRRPAGGNYQPPPPPKNTGSEATIRIFTESHVESHKTHNPIYDSEACSSGRPSDTVLLRPGECLSSTSPFEMRVETSPVCDNGQIPMLFYYANRGCSGNAVYKTNRGDDSMPHDCLGPAAADGSWSVIMRCDLWATFARDVDRHLELRRPDDGGALVAETEAVPAMIQGFLSADCGDYSWERKFKDQKPKEVPVDKCVRFSGNSFRMTLAPRCANGTRATWARFVDERCNMGKVEWDEGMVDVPPFYDEGCLTVGHLKTGNPDRPYGEKIRSFSFWCDGWKEGEDPMPPKKEEEDEKKSKAAQGTVSDNSCWFKKGSPTGSTFIHRSSEQCWGLRPHADLYIVRSAVCENGTEALLARFEGKNCQGTPVALEGVKEDMIRHCLPEEKYPTEDSYAWWCTGDMPVQQPSEPVTNHRDGGGKFVVIFAIVVVSLACVGTAVYCFSAPLTRLARKIKVSRSVRYVQMYESFH